MIAHRCNHPTNVPSRNEDNLTGWNEVWNCHSLAPSLNVGWWQNWLLNGSWSKRIKSSWKLTLVLKPSGDGWQGKLAWGPLLPLHSRDLYCSVLERTLFQNYWYLNFHSILGKARVFPRPAHLPGGLDQTWYAIPMISPRRCLGRGAAGSGRTDDNEESLRKRFVTYEEATMPIIRWEKGTLVFCSPELIANIFQALWKVEPGSPAGCNKVSWWGFCRGGKDRLCLPVRETSVEIVTATSLDCNSLD